MSRTAAMAELSTTLQKLSAYREQNLIDTFYRPGPLSIDNYPKHKACFCASTDCRTTLFVAGNRVGKTRGVGAYSMACHLTGEYPEWWEGKRFDRPILAWAAGDTGKTTREYVQAALLGKPGRFGTGMIRSRDLTRTTAKSGIPDAVDTAYVKWRGGIGESRILFKSYDQGRQSFQGDEVHFILLDEEAPEAIYDESLLRTMTCDGRVLMTFTPLRGLTPLILRFLPGGEIPEIPPHGSSIVMASWDDAPHLTDADKEEMRKMVPPHQRDAREHGKPQLGAGAVYPVPESEIICDPFQIPDHYRICYGLDVGWKKTAAVWLAGDPDTGVWYAFSEHYRGEAEPSVHAAAIRSRGEWVPGVIDPASRGRGQSDGKQLMQSLKDLGLDIENAVNAVESGIYEVWSALSEGRLKIFSTLQNMRAELRIYRRDEKGTIVKENDHLCDSLRYVWMSGRDRAKQKKPKVEVRRVNRISDRHNLGWM